MQRLWKLGLLRPDLRAAAGANHFDAASEHVSAWIAPSIS
jgi:hypothetical protein